MRGGRPGGAQPPAGATGPHPPALNASTTRREVGEVIFQQVTYVGTPVMPDAFRVYAELLAGGGPFPAEG